MGWFAWGFAAGGMCGLGLTALVAVVAYRRTERLQRRARQAERLAELGTLTGGLAHEIKNPLSTVQLNLQLLREDLIPENPAYGRLVARLERVQKETTRLREILDDFLRYAGRLELQPETIDLNDVLADLVDFLAPQAAQNRVQLRLIPAAAPLVTRVDPKLIKQALLNLMLNAMQLMPGGGELIVGGSTRDGMARLTVTDTGPGISEADQAKIFDAYFSKRRGGTGLGLAMTRRIAREHGGHVELASEVGKGSQFAVVLPLKTTG